MADKTNKVVTNVTTDAVAPQTGTANTGGTVSQHVTIVDADGDACLDAPNNAVKVSVVSVSAALQTTSRLTVAKYYGAAAADNITVAAVAGQKHRVYYYEIIVGGATIITIRDGAAGTILRQYDFTGAGSAVCDMLPSLDPSIVGATNTALVVNSTAAVTQNIVVQYATAA